MSIRLIDGVVEFFCILVESGVVVVSVVERGVLKSLTVTMDLSISLCSYMIFQSSIISYQYIDV